MTGREIPALYVFAVESPIAAVETPPAPPEAPVPPSPDLPLALAPAAAMPELPRVTPPPEAPGRQGSPAVLVTVALAGMLAGAMLAGSALGVVEATQTATVARATAHGPSTEANPETAGDGVMDELEEPPPDAGTSLTPASLVGSLTAVMAAPTVVPAAGAGRPAPSAPGPSHARPAPRLITSDNVAAGAVQGYVEGRAVRITVTRIDDKPVEVRTAAAYRRMAEAARRDRVTLRIVSGFRTMEHQEALYRAYRRGRGNLAALPGHSNHQSGHAVDLNTSTPGVLRWLNRHASRFGFRRTVPTEPWHWEWW